MNNEMLQSILQVVREGGDGAKYIIMIHYGYSTVKSLMIASVLSTLIACLYKILKNLIKAEYLDSEDADKLMKGW